MKCSFFIVIQQLSLFYVFLFLPFTFPHKHLFITLPFPLPFFLFLFFTSKKHRNFLASTLLCCSLTWLSCLLLVACSFRWLFSVAYLFGRTHFDLECICSCKCWLLVFSSSISSCWVLICWGFFCRWWSKAPFQISSRWCQTLQLCQRTIHQFLRPPRIPRTFGLPYTRKLEKNKSKESWASTAIIIERISSFEVVIRMKSGKSLIFPFLIWLLYTYYCWAS